MRYAMARHAVTGYDLEAHAVPAGLVEIISNWSTARLQGRARSENDRPYGSSSRAIPEQSRTVIGMHVISNADTGH
jgi:hypothetical protein